MIAYTHILLDILLLLQVDLEVLGFVLGVLWFLNELVEEVEHVVRPEF